MDYTYRVVTKGTDGEYRINDFVRETELLRRYVQIGADDCSLHQYVRGCPVLKGLIGPMIEPGNVLRYETPEVFEQMTKEWSIPARKRRRSKLRVENGQ
ncbi:MAG: hypothetical protein LBT89_05075 [Planctomycetaceae bacterium]|jgi:hypothetical protein|nr:hypothetical protein [Planctomycetaceae bacterium]